MSNLGPIWEDNENYSPPRSNAKQILRDTGTNIVAIASSVQLGAVCPTDTSAGLIKDVLYVCEYDGGFDRVSFKPVFGKHLHDSDTDLAGGSLFNIMHANTGNVVNVVVRPLLADFQITNALSGVATQDGTLQNKLKFDTGATANATSNGAGIVGLALDYGKKLTIQARLQCSANANLVVRFGNSTDRIEDAQDTAKRQCGIEGCDGHGTSWVIINANGTSSSLHVQATTAPLNPSNGNSYKIVNIPATECRLFENGISVGVSTVNVAGDGDSDNARPFVMGIKSTSGAKNLKFWIGQLLGAPEADITNLA